MEVVGKAVLCIKMEDGGGVRAGEGCACWVHALQFAVMLQSRRCN